MFETKEPIRKTIYIEQDLVKRAEILFSESEVNSFSGFVSKALESYITQLVLCKNGNILAREIRKVLQEELHPINTRLSKGLYRYAVILDALLQTVGWRCKITNDAMEQIHKDANRRVAQMKGKVDLSLLLHEGDDGDENDSDDL